MTETIESYGDALLSYIIQDSSGKPEVNSRRLGQNDFIPCIGLEVIPIFLASLISEHNLSL